MKVKEKKGDSNMGNPITKALEKVAKLEARKAKLVEVFKTSEEKRQHTVTKLEGILTKVHAAEKRIQERKNKILTNMDNRIKLAKAEEDILKENIVQATLKMTKK
jgi:hypothetical protein